MFATVHLQKQYALLTNQRITITTQLRRGLVWLEQVNYQLIGMLVCER